MTESIVTFKKFVPEDIDDYDDVEKEEIDQVYILTIELVLSNNDKTVLSMRIPNFNAYTKTQYEDFAAQKIERLTYENSNSYTSMAWGKKSRITLQNSQNGQDLSIVLPANISERVGDALRSTA
tara:strand:- start:53952 stop:54323 length:372 start_codon:yes stop_codon:yes gene_type:complete